MPSGGYKILDAKGANFQGTTQVKIDGFYSAIEATITKPFLLKNFKRNGVERSPIFCTATPSGSVYFLPLYSAEGSYQTLRVDDSDNVSWSLTPVGQAANPSAGDEPSASM